MARLLDRIFPQAPPDKVKIACRYRSCPWSKTLPKDGNAEAAMQRLERSYGAHVRAKHGVPPQLRVIEGGQAPTPITRKRRRSK